MILVYFHFLTGRVRVRRLWIILSIVMSTAAFAGEFTGKVIGVADGDTMAGGSTLDLNFSGTDTIRTLYIGGNWEDAGVWAAVGSTAEHTRVSASLTGSGTLTVLQGPWLVITIK
jgi:hypothetical protein